MTRRKRIAKAESNIIRGLLAAMVLIGCTTTHIQTLALENRLAEDRIAWSAPFPRAANLVARK